MARKPARPGSKPSAGKRIGRIIAGLVVTVVLLGGALVLVDMGLRDFVETRAEAEIKKRVPGSSTAADVTVNGFSILLQVAQGELDDVDADITLASDGLARLASNAGYEGTVSIADGSVVWSTEVIVLENAIPLSVVLDPTLVDTGHLVLTPTDLAVGPDVTIDITPFVNLADLEIRVCSASLLPASIALTGLSVEGDRLALTAKGLDVPTDFDELATRGECVEPEPPAEGETEAPAA